MDIALNVIISALFVSNAMRDDVRLHLIFDGPPSAPRHLGGQQCGGLLKTQSFPK